MYDTCIFDLYGTLVDIRTDENKEELWEKLSLFYAFYGAFYTPEELARSYKRLTGEMTAGHEELRRDSHEAFPEIRIEEVFHALFEEKGIAPDEPLVRHAGQFFRILSMEFIRLYDGTEEMLSAVKESGRKIYLLSNAQRIFTEYEMNALGITKYFDGIFISSDEGCKKPDLKFFRKLIDTCGIDPERAVMVGNDGICDIEGAKRAGLGTVYVHSDISPAEDAPDADYVLPQMDMEQIRKILLS
ncbi:MAG TPA: HAD family hydrolase [Candidatus Mediterraneibacter caccogallinarum]|nr:HAD family hydrolase [Candidatus Mediterraneibacter caccogallinarum]